MKNKIVEKLVKDYRKELKGRAKGRDMSRLDGFFDSLLGSPPKPDDPRQRMGQASPLWVPGLPAAPWHDPATLPYHDRLRALHPALLKEGKALLDAGALTPSTEGRKDLSYQGWVGFKFSSFDEQIRPDRFRLENVYFPENLERAPVAAELLEGLPVLGDCFYSALLPGGRISPHYSHFNAKLVCHLGLSVPQECAIRVADETRTWKDGEVLLFDDTYEHESWNRSKRPRLLLHLVVWHPALTPFEVEALEGFFRSTCRP